MTETVFSARPALHAPGVFLRDAVRDLALAVPIARRLFGASLRGRQRRAWLGHMSLIVPPLAGVGACVLMQSRRIVDVAPTALPYALFVLSGIVLWQVFVDALLAPLAQLTGARRMLRGQRIPHEAFIGAGLLDVALNAALRFVLLAVALFLFADPVWSWLLVPVAAAVLAILGLAIGIIVAPVGLLYDDIGRGLHLLASFGMFLAPVLYPLPATGVFALNPVAPPLAAARLWLLGPAMPDAALLVVLAGSLAVLVLGWLFYRLARPHVIARQA